MWSWMQWMGIGGGSKTSAPTTTTTTTTWGGPYQQQVYTGGVYAGAHTGQYLPWTSSTNTTWNLGGVGIGKPGFKPMEEEDILVEWALRRAQDFETQFFYRLRMWAEIRQWKTLVNTQASSSTYNNLLQQQQELMKAQTANKLYFKGSPVVLDPYTLGQK